MPRSVFFVLFIFFISSCKTKNNDDLIKLMQENSIEANKIIHQSTERAFEDLNRKQYEPENLERALVWLPKAKQVRQICDSAYIYIERIKVSTPLTKTDIFQLFKKLTEYNADLLKVDTELDSAFRRNLPLIPIDSAAFSKKYFANNSGETQKAVLLQLQNRIIIIKNRFITESANKCETLRCFTSGYDLPLFYQNSTILKPGDTFSIKAGIGFFSRAAIPRITINGKHVMLNEEALSAYEIIAPQTPGTYMIPINIKYFNQMTGKEESFSKNIEYTVAKECN